MTEDGTTAIVRCIAEAALRPKRILVIDDSPSDREIFRLLARSFICELEEAETGEAGVELALTKKFDLIFVDIGLPGMSGTEVIGQIRIADRIAGSRHKIIILSGVITIDTIRAVSRYGCIVFVCKPDHFDDAFMGDLLGTFGIERR